MIDATFSYTSDQLAKTLIDHAPLPDGEYTVDIHAVQSKDGTDFTIELRMRSKEATR